MQPRADEPDVVRANTDWLHEAGWGVFTHYATNPEDPDPGWSRFRYTVDHWNELVDAFDLHGFVGQLVAVGARYLLFTVGQNSGFYCAPNETYDSIVGYDPSRCSRRDLVSDLADALSPHGIRLMVYLPSGAPKHDRHAREKLKWRWGYVEDWPSRKGPQTDDRLAEFQHNWEAVIREWAQRWGDKVAGWWFDGCYFADAMYRHPDPPNFASFAASAKAGNPDRIVAFNPGVPPLPWSEFDDYTAGEVASVFPVCPGRWLDGAQWHVASYLGRRWRRGEDPRFCDEFVIGYTKDCISKDGVVTWDVPISPKGQIPQPFVDQLTALSRGLSRDR